MSIGMKLATGTKARPVWMALFLGMFGASFFATGCKNFFTPINGTGSGTPVVNTGDYAYVASVNASSSTSPIYTLSGFSIGTASLTALSGFPLTLPFAPSTAVVSPSNGLLYVAGSQVVYGYTINSSGALTNFVNSNGKSALVNANIIQMVVSPDGNWLLGLDGTLDGAITTIHVYPISSSGQLGADIPAQYSITGGATIVPNTIAVSMDGNFVAVSLGTGGDVLFSFDTSTGVLTPETQVNTQSPSGADQALAFDSTSSILFIARSGTGAGVYPYQITNSGANLTAATGAPFPLGAGASSIALDTTSKYLYVGNKTDSNISGFSIGSGGVLTVLGGSPYAGGSNVNALAADNSGKYLLSTALSGSPDLKLYSFDGTTAGALDPSAIANLGDPTEPAGSLAIAVTHPSN